VAKACLELGGRSWNDKTVGIACATGSMVSYMSHMGLAASLMLDFRCVIVPRFVYATGDAFKDGKLADEAVQTRMAELCGSLSDLARRRM
jgi:FMN reductase